MATYIGFSTIGVNRKNSSNYGSSVGGDKAYYASGQIVGKKFKLTDKQLVLQDFLNALNIPQGQKPGKPSYGTTIWSFLFEPNSAENHAAIENEIRRVALNEPRLVLNTINAYPEENGIRIEAEIAIRPTNDVSILNLYFNRDTNTANIIGNDF